MLVPRRIVRDVQSEPLGLSVREHVPHHGQDQRGVPKGRQRNKDFDRRSVVHGAVHEGFENNEREPVRCGTPVTRAATAKRSYRGTRGTRCSGEGEDRRRADTTASTDNPIGLCAWHTTRGAASAAGICVGVLVRPARISQRQSAAATRKDLILLILSVSYPSGWWKARPDVVGYVLQSAAPTGPSLTKPSPWFYWGVSSSPYVYFICCT